MLPNNNASNNNVVTKLYRQFLSGSLHFSLNDNEIESLTPEAQEEFLQLTIHNDRFKNYPVNNEFCILFFKKIISYLETKQDIRDEIYSYLGSALQKPSKRSLFSHHHYIIKDTINTMITIKETKHMVVHGTTGLKIWEAAFMLSDWALCNEDVIANKKILELGSGVGFTGIVIALHCNIQSIVLTDYHEEVLNTITDNIKINLYDYKQSKTPNMTVFSGRQNSIGVTRLDWECMGDIPDELVPDILIGADIVYDPSTLPALCNVLQTFFTKNNNLEVYIASVIRNEDTINQFLELLDKSGLKYEEVQVQPVRVEWDHEIKRKFLKINNK